MEKIVLLSFLFVGTLITNTKTDSYSLTIKTIGLENSEGTVIFALYNTDGSIPDQKLKKYYRKQKTRIIGEKSEITFSDLSRGTYAVTVLHDENNNGKMDKKLLLPLPDEGVGFSNHQNFGVSNRPNFKNSSFNLNKDTVIEIKIIYK